MYLKRKEKYAIEFTEFKVGDTFTFKMKDGEKVKVRAVKEIGDNMLFIFEDCLRDEYTMNQIINENVLGNIYKRIPKKIRKMLITFEDGTYLRLPTEKEIFGENNYGEKESDDVKQFKCMKKRKHRIAFQGYGTDELEWYWLANRCDASATDFACVDGGGISNSVSASYGDGVRPLFLIKNL